MLKKVVCFVLFIELAFACGGYKVNFDPIRKCDDDSVIYSKDFTLTLDSNCQMVVKGCAIFSKPIKSAKANYVVKKPPMPDLVGKVDLCKVLVGTSKYKVVQYLVEKGIKCPLEAKKVCANGKEKIDLSKIRDKLPLLMGKSDLTVEMEHDSGKSCFQTSLDVRK